MRKIKPLTGQALLQLIPDESNLPSNLIVPDRYLSAEEVQERHRTPEDTKPKPRIAVVREIGAWPKTKNGLLRLPEFGKGSKVIVSALVGTRMQRNIGEQFVMVSIDDVLAVIP